MMYLEVGLLILGIALLLQVLFCIPLFLKLWRAANDVTVTLQILNERLPAIMKNVEEISSNINHSTTAINGEVQKYAATADRFHIMMEQVVTGMELISTFAFKLSLYRKMAWIIPVAKGIRAFINVLSGKQRV